MPAKIQQTVCIVSPLGILKIEGDDNGVSAIRIDEAGIISNQIPTELQDVVTQLQEYFNKQRTQFDVRLQPAGTDFQKKVWTELQNIPHGTTISYLNLAKKMGNPKVIRAAAAANGKNPLLIVIPCHRVIGADGSLTGFSAGLWRKKWLLEHEILEPQGQLF